MRSPSVLVLVYSWGLVHWEWGARHGGFWLVLTAMEAAASRVLCAGVLVPSSPYFGAIGCLGPVGGLYACPLSPTAASPDFEAFWLSSGGVLQSGRGESTVRRLSWRLCLCLWAAMSSNSPTASTHCSLRLLLCGGVCLQVVAVMLWWLGTRGFSGVQAFGPDLGLSALLAPE